MAMIASSGIASPDRLEQKLDNLHVPHGVRQRPSPRV
jgi:hypothetical protein